MRFLVGVVVAFLFFRKKKKNKREKRRYIVPIMTSENMACCVGRGTRHDSDGSSYRSGPP